MSELRKANSDNAFFVTITVVGWIDVFTRAYYCDEIIRNLEYCQKNKGLKIYAYCIMSSHIHMIISHDQAQLPKILRDFKSYTAKRIIEMIETNNVESRKDWLLHLFKYYAKFHNQNSEYMFWQKTSHPIELVKAPVYQQKVDYIHQNPVKSGLIKDECSYTYSSACLDSPLKLNG